MGQAETQRSQAGACTFRTVWAGRLTRALGTEVRTSWPLQVISLWKQRNAHGWYPAHLLFHAPHQLVPALLGPLGRALILASAPFLPPLCVPHPSGREEAELCVC